MFCQYQYFVPPQSQMMMTNPPSSHSDRLFHIISLALRKNLKQFTENRTSQVSASTRKVQTINEEPKISETVTIDLLSQDESKKEQTLPKEKWSMQIEKQAQKVEQIQADSKQNSEKGRQTDGSSQNIPQTNLIEVSRQIEQEIQNIPTLANRIYTSLQQDKLMFTTECPKLGLDKESLLKKKQSLLNRRVKDWSLIPEKGGKQRREIKMLNN